MSVRNDLNGEVLSDIVSFSALQDGTLYFALGETAKGDTPIRAYYYDVSSTITPSGDSVVIPTSNVGRLIKQPIQIYWNDVISKPSFATVATSGAYGDLSGTPTIPSTTTAIAEGSNLYYTNARARAAISLTTTGSSGVATYNNSTGELNIPNYTSSATVSSVGISSTDFSISGSPITTSGTITANLNTSGVGAGTYRGAYTVNSKGIVTTAINHTVNDNVSRSLSNAAGSTNQYTISATQPAHVNYSITMNFTVTALLSSSASVFLEYSTNGGSSWITVSQVTTSFGLGLALTGSNDMSLSGYIPENGLVRLRPATTNATCVYQRGQEILI